MLENEICSAAEAIRQGNADCVLLHPNTEPFYGHGRGVRPLVQLLEQDPVRLKGALLVDKIIGKAAAMLAVLGGVKQVYALTISLAGQQYLQAHGIAVQGEVTVEQIFNRTGDGLCPLEQSVLELEDAQQGYRQLKKTIARLMAGKAPQPENLSKDSAADAAPQTEEKTMAYLGENIKKLGFGLMRLPMLGEEVDLEQTKAMVDLFMEKGFNYFDTAYGYLNGKSEAAAKAALVDRYPRESFQLATKLPAWAGPKTAEEAKQMFWTSLERTGAGYFDFYLLHNLGDERTHFFDDYGIWEFAAELKAKGLVRHVGFSFHDKADVLEEILNAHPEAEFVQLQINYADWESSTIESRKCYEVARRHQKPVIIMEPVKGGSLANLPDSVADIFRAAEPQASLSSWAVRFAASLEGLVTVLSGMSTLQQMEDNLSYMAEFQPLTEQERATVAKAQAALAAISTVPCTDCRYCVKDCPQGVAIPGVFKALNNYLVYNNLPGAKGTYGFETREGGVASRCIGCGHCESVCPQHISIVEELKHAAGVFEQA